MKLVNLPDSSQSPSLNPFAERLGMRWLSVAAILCAAPTNLHDSFEPTTIRGPFLTATIQPVLALACVDEHVNEVGTCTPEMQLF